VHALRAHKRLTVACSEALLPVHARAHSYAITVARRTGAAGVLAGGASVGAPRMPRTLGYVRSVHAHIADRTRGVHDE
jgi:hypothetical protein